MLALLGKHCKVSERPHQFFIQMPLLFGKSPSHFLMSYELQNHLKTVKCIRSTFMPKYFRVIKPRSFLSNTLKITTEFRFWANLGHIFVSFLNHPYCSYKKKSLSHFIINSGKRQTDLVSHCLKKFRPFWALFDPLFFTNVVPSLVNSNRIFSMEKIRKAWWTNSPETLSLYRFGQTWVIHIFPKKRVLSLIFKVLDSLTYP